MHGLSPIDIRILHEMQKDASRSTAELADQVGLSQSPCWRRLQKLKEEGYIARQVAILNREKIGQPLIIFATLKVSTLTEEKRAEFLRKVDLTPQIVECHTMIGERDIILKIVAASHAWYQTFIFDMVLKLPGVLDVQSMITLLEVKSTTALPLRHTLAA